MFDEGRGITFFVWADTHFGYEQRSFASDLRGGIIDQMNALPGWPYPPPIGGVVEKPAFVAHLGDVVDGCQGQAERELAYYRYFLDRLEAPHYEVLGNHDVTAPFMDYFLAKYQAKSYSFARRGVHFISLNSEYDEHEVGHVEPTDLDFLQRNLGGVADETPVVLLTHGRVDRLTNGQDVLKILRSKPVILILSAHTHKPAAFTLDGIACLDVGHCRNHPIDPEYGRNFGVIRLAGNEILAIPWRWDLKDWERGQRWTDDAAPPFILRTTF